MLRISAPVFLALLGFCLPSLSAQIRIDVQQAASLNDVVVSLRGAKPNNDLSSDNFGIKQIGSTLWLGTFDAFSRTKIPNGAVFTLKANTDLNQQAKATAPTLVGGYMMADLCGWANTGSIGSVEYLLTNADGMPCGDDQGSQCQFQGVILNGDETNCHDTWTGAFTETDFNFSVGTEGGVLIDDSGGLGGGIGVGQVACGRLSIHPNTVQELTDPIYYCKCWEEEIEEELVPTCSSGLVSARAKE
jgi:hypothetical protein